MLFAAERKVCDQMFEGFEQIKDQCFAEVTTGSVAVLLSFGDAIAKSKRSPEKLFVLLDMYEIMRELHSEVWNFNIATSFGLLHYSKVVKVELKFLLTFVLQALNQVSMSLMW